MADSNTKPRTPATRTRPGTLSLTALKKGDHARRESWAAGVVIFIGDIGGRGGAKPALMMTGSRSGLLPWRRENDDDLLADDWIMIDPTKDVKT